MDRPKASEDLANRSLRSRRVRDMSAFLPIAGIFVFMTPIMRVFSVEFSALGVPVPFLFLFGCWIGLIFLSWRLSLKISQETDE